MHQDTVPSDVYVYASIVWHFDINSYPYCLFLMFVHRGLWTLSLGMRLCFLIVFWGYPVSDNGNKSSYFRLDWFSVKVTTWTDKHCDIEVWGNDVKTACLFSRNNNNVGLWGCLCPVLKFCFVLLCYHRWSSRNFHLNLVIRVHTCTSMFKCYNAHLYVEDQTNNLDFGYFVLIW